MFPFEPSGLYCLARVTGIGHYTSSNMFIKPLFLFALVGTALAVSDGAAKKKGKRQANMSELSVLYVPNDPESGMSSQLLMVPSVPQSRV